MSEEILPPPLPHAVGPEKSILSSMLQEPQEFIPQAISEGLTDRHFHLPNHSALFSYLLKLFADGKEIELVSLVQGLLDAGQLDQMGGPSAVTDLYTYAPTAGHFRNHLQIVKDKHVLRSILQTANDVIARVYDEPEEPLRIVEFMGTGLESAKESLAATRSSSFPITRASETAGTTAAIDFVERLLIEGGASVIYGPSNCGKSFWILDLAVSVATGKPFRNELEVDQGAVVYVALEGSTGVRNRIEALRLMDRIDDSTPLFLCFAPVSLLESTHPGKLAESVKQAASESGLPCRLVVLDTLARAMAGGDENGAPDMTAAVASIDAIRAATGAHVAVVHHCGKDEAKGARGHSSLRAAVDTEIEVFRPEGESITTVRVTKQRDLPLGDPMPFSLKVVEVGTDRRNNPITSCVVHHEDEMMASKPSKAGRKPLCSAEDMLDFLPAENPKDWMARVAEDTGLGKSQFYEHKKALEAAGKVRREAATNRLVRA